MRNEYEVTIRATIIVTADDEDDAADFALQELDIISDVTSSGVEDVRKIGE